MLRIVERPPAGQRFDALIGRGPDDECRRRQFAAQIGGQPLDLDAPDRIVRLRLVEQFGEYAVGGQSADRPREIAPSLGQRR